MAEPDDRAGDSVPKLIDHVDFRYYSARKYPVAYGTIPTHLMADFEILLREVQVVFPQHTYETLTRYIWARGLAAVRHAINKRHYPNPSKDPRTRIAL